MSRLGQPDDEPDFTPAESIDTVALMRFLGMPGVPQLLHAYSRIPPGKLRQNLIATAMSVAEAYEVPPPGPMADPLMVVSAFHPQERGEPVPTAPALTGPEPKPRGRPPKPKPSRPLSVEEKVVELRMAGKYTDEIARELNVDAGWAGDVLVEAREKGGLHYPKLPSRADKKYGGTFHVELQFVTNAGRAKLASMAKRLGTTLPRLMSARKLFVEMRAKNRTMEDIAKATKLPEKELWQWLYKARAAGHELPLDVSDDAQARPALPLRPADAPIRLPSHASFMARQVRSAAYKIEKAAKDRGVSIPEYEYLREVVVDLALSGMRQIEIAQAVGEPGHWVGGVLRHAEKIGVPIDFEKMKSVGVAPKPEPSGPGEPPAAE